MSRIRKAIAKFSKCKQKLFENFWKTRLVLTRENTKLFETLRRKSKNVYYSEK